MTYLRRLDLAGPIQELVLFRVDASGAWTLVRRARLRSPLPEFTIRSAVGLPDGRFVLSEADPDHVTGDRIVELPPDGEPRVIWREHDVTTVRVHGWHVIFAMPTGARI